MWSGIGAVGVALFGIALFGESMTTARMVCIPLIVSGILGLKLLGGESAARLHDGTLPLERVHLKGGPAAGLAAASVAA